MKRLRVSISHYLFVIGLALLYTTGLGFAGSAVTFAQEPKPETTAPSAAPVKVMRDYNGIKLGMKRDEVRAALGKMDVKEKEKDRFVLRGDNRLTAYYDNDQVKVMQLYFADAQSAPKWEDVVGDAEVIQMASGAKRARRDVPEEKFWISMYQNKDGSITTITISR